MISTTRDNYNLTKQKCSNNFANKILSKDQEICLFELKYVDKRNIFDLFWKLDIKYSTLVWRFWKQVGCLQAKNIFWQTKTSRFNRNDLNYKRNIKNLSGNYIFGRSSWKFTWLDLDWLARGIDTWLFSIKPS